MASISALVPCSRVIVLAGDIGYLDEDNHLYITDRLKELIKYKGLQVMVLICCFIAVLLYTTGAGHRKKKKIK